MKVAPDATDGNISDKITNYKILGAIARFPSTKETLMGNRCKSIVEIGCGTGKNTLLLSQIAQTAYAVDFSASMIEKAKEKVNSVNVIFITADITKQWICSNESADLITCNLVLEHIEDLSFIFSEAYRVLVQGGYFFICELHPFRQYRGTQANFQRNQELIKIPAFIHHLSDFFQAGLFSPQNL